MRVDRSGLTAFHKSAFFSAVTVLALAAVPAFGQDAPNREPAPREGTSQSGPKPQGYPHDWSHNHVVFSAPKTPEDLARIQKDPRYWHQQYHRAAKVAAAPVSDALPAISLEALINSAKTKTTIKKDWSMDMGSTSTKVGADNTPAKYSFSIANPTTANCAGGSAPDYVVYNTSVAGSTTQASIVAYDNLYSGLCSNAVPQTYWAYDTLGTVETSVSLSEDGTQVAFINSTSPAQLVLLKWAPPTSFTGTTHGTTSITSVSVACPPNNYAIYGPGIPLNATVTSCSGTAPNVTIVMSASATASGTGVALTYSATAAVPTVLSVTPVASYRSCTAPCMTEIPFGNSGTDTISSPYVDYGDDIIYVGDATANVHKFMGVFKGTVPGEALAAHSSAATGVVGGTTVTTTAATFTSADVGSTITDSKSGIPSGTTIVSVESATSVTISKTATSETADTITITPAATWPVQIAPAKEIGGVVYDSGSGNVFANNQGSSVYAISSTSATIVASHALNGTGTDILEAPIVDSSEGKVYVFVDGCQSGCSSPTGLNRNYVAQLPVGLASAILAPVSASAPSSTYHQLYSGAFDNEYYNTGTGHLYVCGNTEAAPTLYQISITTGTMSATATTGPALAATGNQCSPISENLSVYATDALTAGMTASQLTVPVTANSAFANGDYIQIDSEIMLIGSGGGSATLTVTRGQTGTTGATHLTGAVVQQIHDNFYVAVTGGGTPSACSSGGCMISFDFTSGAAIGTGTASSAAITSTSGASGSIIDNIGTAAGSSQIYYSTLGSTTCTTSGTSGGCAVQAAQNGL